MVRNKSALPWVQGWYAYVKETGTTIGPGHTWHYIKALVGQHLDKNGLNVGDREQYLHDAVCMAMERDGRGGQCIKPFRLSINQERNKAYDADPRVPAGLKRGKPGYDAYAWASIHLAALDGKLNTNFIKHSIARIGCGSCRAHAQRYLMKHPVPAPELAFEWTVNFHNSVSATIKKPVVSLAQARELWGAK